MRIVKSTKALRVSRVGEPDLARLDYKVCLSEAAPFDEDLHWRKRLALYAVFVYLPDNTTYIAACVRRRGGSCASLEESDGWT